MEPQHPSRSPQQPQRAPVETLDRAPVETLEREPRLDDGSDGDHDRFAHIVYPKAKLTEAIVMGTPVTALCGKTWVPGRDPQRYAVCPTCKERFAAMGKDFGALS